MRAKHQAWHAPPRGPLAFVAAADISDCVEMRGHSGFALPGEDEIGSGAMLRRQEYPRQIFRRPGNGPELIDPPDDLVAKRRSSRPGNCRLYLAHAFPV